MENKQNLTKTRNWAYMLYPDSVPDDWREMLADTHMQIYISPLHDRDIDEFGNYKKPHWHIVISSDGPITQKRANEIMQPFCGTQSAEYIKSLRGYVRYLAHLDDPDKFQYDPNEIIALGGAELTDYLTYSNADKQKIVCDIVRFCEENAIYETSELTIIAISEHEEWLRAIIDKTYFFVQVLSSFRHSRRK